MTVSEMIQRHSPEYHTIESYPAKQTVCIRKVKNEWGILCNLSYTHPDDTLDLVKVCQSARK